jgi:hypothetical protein
MQQYKNIMVPPDPAADRDDGDKIAIPAHVSVFFLR